MAKLTSILVGAAVVGLAGGVIYLGMSSGNTTDSLIKTYQSLRPRDRFIGMLYLTAEQDGQLMPAEDLSRLVRDSQAAAILAMELFTKTSKADRKLFVETVFSPYSPLERLFTLEDVRAVRAALDKDKIAYSSDLALNVLRNDYPRIAVRVGMSVGAA